MIIKKKGLRADLDVSKERKFPCQRPNSKN